MVRKIWRSPYTRFGGLISTRIDDSTDETLHADALYRDEDFAEIAARGFNAIWVHGVISSLAHVEPFTELGANREAHMRAMRQLIARAARHGLRVFIYTQTMRAVAVANKGFWARHSELGGQESTAVEQMIPETMDKEERFRCLCPSTEPVRRWHRKAAAQIAESLPGLGGLILITASEYPSHCYGQRGNGRSNNKDLLATDCPRCKKREPWEVISDLVTLVRDGVREVSAEADIIAWNWCWDLHLPPPCRELVDALPRDVILMSDFERGGVKDFYSRPGRHIGEYSLSYGGPSELCRLSHKTARARGLRVMSKLQLGTTHELGSVVSLPLLGSIYDKALYHRENPDCGYMGCWNFGNMPESANTSGFNYFMSEECPVDKARALPSFAAKYFPGCDARLAAMAWETFGEAMRHFPYSIPFMYNGPHTHALAYQEVYKPGPLAGGSAGYSYLDLTGWRGDDLSSSIDGVDYSLDELIDCLGRTSAVWRVGVARLREALAGCDDRREIGNAVIVGACLASACNAYRAYRLRKSWDDSKSAELARVVADELAVVGEALPWVEKDSRQGCHGEAGKRFFDPESMRRKLDALEKLPVGGIEKKGA